MARKRKVSGPEPGDALDRLDAHGWVTITGGSGEPWTEGVTVEGTLGVIEDSGFEQDDGAQAQIVHIITLDGERVFRCPAVLLNRLQRLSTGDRVRIACLGKVKTSGGRKAWNFDVKAQPQHALKPALRVAPAKRGRPRGSKSKK